MHTHSDYHCMHCKIVLCCKAVRLARDVNQIFACVIRSKNFLTDRRRLRNRYSTDIMYREQAIKGV